MLALVSVPGEESGGAMVGVVGKLTIQKVPPHPPDPRKSRRRRGKTFEEILSDPQKPQKPEKPRKTGGPPPPPVLYQHLKIVRGLFLDLIFRP